MNNILAIAHKELKSYFSTPIAYVVIGFFALLFGYFFYAMLVIFNQQSAQFGGAVSPSMPEAAVDVTEQRRPLRRQHDERPVRLERGAEAPQHGRGIVEVLDDV